MNSEFKIISDIIKENTRVRDVGCDDGSFMEFLKKNKNVDIRGIELSSLKFQYLLYQHFYFFLKTSNQSMYPLYNYYFLFHY
jgi:hypothetical protein